jgi:IS5 family transposase
MWICCGFAVQLVVKTNPQQIEQVELELKLWADCNLLARRLQLSYEHNEITCITGWQTHAREMFHSARVRSYKGFISESSI